MLIHNKVYDQHDSLLYCPQRNVKECYFLLSYRVLWEIRKKQNKINNIKILFLFLLFYYFYYLKYQIKNIITPVSLIRR